MAFDINWGLLTEGNRSLGNALAGVGQQIGERRERARTNNALADAQANPKDAAAQERLRRVDPRLAMQNDQMQREKVRQLRADQQAELGYAARAFDGVTDEAGYRNAVANIQRAGFDISDYPQAYDPAQISSIVKLGQMLNPVDPVKLGEGDKLINPRTKEVIAQGNPKPTRYYPVAPGGMLVPEPGSGGTNVPTITADQFAALPSGSQFIAADDPTRQIRIKP